MLAAPGRKAVVVDSDARLAGVRSESAGVERLLLSVDGGGQVLVVTGARLTLGHVRAGDADLPFLADVGALHAWLERRDSLHDGPSWRIVAATGEDMRVNGRPEAAAVLHDGDRVLLGRNLELLHRVPDPASASAVFELPGGPECLGARRICLLAEGPGGRLGIGAHAGSHVPAEGPSIELVLAPGRLVLHAGAPLATAGSSPSRALSLPLPLPRRLDVRVGEPPPKRPPFLLTLEPLPSTRSPAE